MIKKLLGAALLAVLPCLVQAATPKLVGPIDNETNLSVSKTVNIPMNGTSVDQLAVQLNYSTSGAPGPFVFTDGSASSFTVTVASNTALSTATASDFLTVLTTNSLSNACITFFNGTQYQVCNGGRWRVDVTSDTAFDIATQMSGQISVLTSTANGGSTVYSTATVAGSFANSWTLSSNTSSITVNTANFTGGQSGVCLGVGTFEFCAGNQFAVGTSSAITANNLSLVLNSTYTL